MSFGKKLLYGTIFLGLLVALTAKILPIEKKCNLVIVQWQDATSYSTKGSLLEKTLETDESLTTASVSIGCLVERKTEIVVIHNIQDGVATDFIAIPKNWVNKIVPLKEDKERPPQGSH